MVNVPCSHAAHLEVQGYRNYRSQWTQTINRNYKRFVQVWLPEYMEYFYPYFPSFEVGYGILSCFIPASILNQKKIRK